MDYSAYLKSANGREKFDIIFLDPPYAKSMKDEILKKLTRTDILADGCIVICETDKDDIDGDVHGLCNDGKVEFIYISVTSPPIDFGYAYKEKR